MQRTKTFYASVLLFLLIALLSIIVILWLSKDSQEEQMKYSDLVLFRGHLHSHTSLSDGKKLPDDAYEFVKKHTDLDFFSITEHDVILSTNTNNDYISDYKESHSEAYRLMHEQSNAHNEDHEFVTIPGIEVTWYDNAGHMNLFNTPWFPRTHAIGGASISWIIGGNSMYNLPTFYARLAEDPDAIAQFNHPSKDRHGNFFDFNHYNQEVDQNIQLYEYRLHSNYPLMFFYFVQSLDKGWHISPTYSGDEHNDAWGTNGDYMTGVWAKELTREGIYEALKNRRTYASFDRNFELKFSANGYLMGSILPGDTEEIDVLIDLKDPDLADHIETVQIYTNEGEIVKEYTDIHSNEFFVEETFPSEDGDYFFIRVIQRDEDEMISAPIWIGEVTRGTHFAPEITIEGELPEQVVFGEKVNVPEATALDHDNEPVDVSVTLFDSKGKVPFEGNAFDVEEYGEYFVRYTAIDDKKSTRVALKRIVVSDEILDVDKIVNEFTPIVNVGEDEAEVNINLVTDKVLQKAVVQYKPKHQSWDDAEQTFTETSNFDIVYGETTVDAHYRLLASHKATLANLQEGTVYEYRFGISDEESWGKTHTFETADRSDETVIYVMGDLEPAFKQSEGFDLFNQMLNVLKEKNGAGRLLVQLGNLIFNAGHVQSWQDRLESMFSTWDLISAHMLGESEIYTKKEWVDSFSGFFNLPHVRAGLNSRHYYSFDYGDVHVAVLHTLENIENQLEWLEEDLQNSNKPWKVVMGHYAYFGGKESDKIIMERDRKRLIEVFEKSGVHLYIGGHDQIYKRTTIHNLEKTEDPNKGITFVSAGSAGPSFGENKEFEWDQIVYDENVQTGIVLEANNEALKLRAFNIEGEEVDTFVISLDE